MDHRDLAEQQLARADSITTGDPGESAQSALTHALIALVDRLDELSCLMALPFLEEDDA